MAVIRLPGLSEEPVTVAAVDLGSNSFHMMVARAGQGGLQVIDRLREPVRLAEGLTADKSLAPDAESRALECLERFGERLRDIPPSRVRVVGTNTLRRLRRARRFLLAAEERLGHPVEVIAGVEEARLIYGGVTHGLPADGTRRLVVDIGGGSTELIIGADDGPVLMESVHMGCVSWTQEFFADGQITRRRLKQGRLAASAALKFLGRAYRAQGWDVALGASGSVRAVWRVAAAMQMGEHVITRAGIEAIEDALARQSCIDELELPGLREDRRPVFPGSFTVLAGIFDTLNMDQLEISDRALREGLVYDLLGRLADHDVRDRSARALAERFKLDRAQASRVETIAMRLLDQVADSWKLDQPGHADMLSWAAQLHEVGMGVSHAGYHKHSAYVLAHVDLHGFSRTDQQILGAIVRCHRGKWVESRFDDLPRGWRKRARRLAILLRIAVIMNRGRNPGEAPDIRAAAISNGIRLQLPDGWLDQHPLTQTDFEQEAARLAASGFKLEFGPIQADAGGK